eukprot:6546413-Pyramimonas_sp.AAC.1
MPIGNRVEFSAPLPRPAAFTPAALLHMRSEDHAVRERDFSGGLEQHVVQLGVRLQLGVHVVVGQEREGLAAVMPLLLLEVH